MLTLGSAKLTGVPSATAWSQVHEFLPQDPEKIKTRGHLFAVIAAPNSGREILSRLHEEYFGDTTIKPFNALKLAVEKVTKEFESTDGSVEIAAISFVESVVYSAAGGGSQIMISREGSLATILASHVREVVSASGFPKEGDLVIIGTKSFFGKVSIEMIKTALQTGSPESAVESFAPTVHGDENSGGMGAVVIEFRQEAPAEEVITSPTQTEVPAKPRKSLKELIGRFSRFLPERKIYIKTQPDFQPTPQGKKTTLLVGVILLAILAVSIGFGVRQKNVKEKQAARAQKELEASQLEAAGYYKTEPELFLDLTLLSSGFKGDKLSFSNGNLFVLDKNGKKIVSIELPSKKSKVVAGQGKLTQAEDLASYEDRVFVLDSEGIKEVEEEPKSVVEKDWEGEALIHAFAGNLYVLDKGAGVIYRFSGSDGSFGSKYNWLSSDTKPDFSNVSAWTFDGSIYVLTSSSKILKLSQGSPQNFALPAEISSADAIFASDENEFIYILDKSSGKVVVTGKNGEFKAQYSSDKISEAVGLMASEAEKKIILLTGEKLLSIEMKHF